MRSVAARLSRTLTARPAVPCVSPVLRLKPSEYRIGATSGYRSLLPGYQPSRTLALTVARTDVGGLQYLQARFDFDEAKMDLLKRKLMFCPGEDAIAASCAGVQAHLGLSDEELRKMVIRLPAIIGYNFDSNLRPKLDWLQGTFGLTRQQLLSLVQRHKVLLGSSLEKALIPNVAFWRECFAGLSDAEVHAKILANPRQITQSHSRLRGRAALFDARGIPRALLWGKASYTDQAFSESLQKWVGRE